MNHLLLARLALSSLCAIQGIATLAIDLNRTHATNPTWPGHARFHVVWQSLSVALFSIVELMLIWSRSPNQSVAFYFAALLAGVSPLGFLIAFAGRRIFHGTLSDPNGIPPLSLVFFGKRVSVDLNFAAVVAALISIAAIVWIYGI